jgi:hypothetical protein
MVRILESARKRSMVVVLQLAFWLVLAIAISFDRHIECLVSIG